MVCHDKETFVDCIPVVKGGVELSAKEAPMKEKTARWKLGPFYLRCCERLDILGVGSEWGRYRICCATMGVTSVGADLLCSPMLEWGMVVPVLQHNAQYVGYPNISLWRTT